ncbi:unnamed protein product [Cyprideis torosa]|uniref:Structural maintenance of chromosomes protein n=1 Tax=Cyprideis torosa TaxID=163714 RepID=A0A7R8WJY0_9CRUS|nr:unnamed protein product [Cyprideis torosa]CAG0896289.1 unnamed protein product [Cyprideis torosa]
MKRANTGGSGRKKKAREATEESSVVSDEETEKETFEMEPGGRMVDDIYIPPPPPPSLTFDEGSPRLIISHITNDNFKSYAGKHILGPFNKSFTAIVGPNGSGKSNVIDSMLFVFGYRAQKLRSKKVGVLIHSSNEHQNIQSCTVSVHFEVIQQLPSGELLNFEDRKFVVSRTAFRDNSSYYTINGKRCTFKEIQRKLMETGVDMEHNRFLILQGEVESISLMKPKAASEQDSSGGMLEYLEDVIGSSRLKEPIKQLEQRVEVLTEEREAKMKTVKIISKEKDALQGPKDEAQQFQRNENQIIRIKNAIYQFQVYDHEKQKAQEEEKRKETEEGARELLSKLDSIKQNQKEAEVQLKESQSAYTKFSSELEEAAEEFKKCEIEDTTLHEEIQKSVAERKKNMAQLKSEKLKLDKLEKVPEKNEGEIKELEVRKESLEKSRQDLEDKFDKALAALGGETQELQRKLTVEEEKLIDLRTNVNDAKSKMDLAAHDLQVYGSNEQRERTELETLMFNFQDSEGKLGEAKKKQADTQSRMPVLEAQIKKNQAERETLLAQRDNLNQELRTVQGKLQETRSSFQSTSNRSAVLRALMKEKEQGRLKGIIGRLGDLGGISEEYDVAISTACPALENIVVDTVETAKAASQFLKEGRVGQARFSCLHELKKNFERQAHSRIQTPQNVPRLFDLVDIPNKDHRVAFYHALRDVLVARDLNQANQVAYGAQRFRVVTLDGDLIEVSGTMSGGGTSKIRGRMGKNAPQAPQVNPQELERMEQRCGELEGELGTMQNRLDELEAMIRRDDQELRPMASELKKLEGAMKGLVENAAFLKTRIKEQEAKVKAAAPDPKKVEQLTRVHAELQKVYNEAAEKSGVTETKVKHLKDDMEQLREAKVGVVEKRMNNCKEELRKVTQAITKLSVGINTNARDLKKCRAKVEDLEQDIKDREERIKECQAKKEELTARAEDKSQKIASEEHTTAKKLVEKFREEENKLKSEKMKVEEALAVHDEKIRELTSLLKRDRHALKGLELTSIAKEKVPPLATLTEEELENFEVKNEKKKMAALEEKLKGRQPNLNVIDEYFRKEEQYMDRVRELEGLTRDRDRMRENFDSVSRQRLKEFMDGFNIINLKLKEMYRMITLGGDAELELVDTTNPFLEGIAFSVRPPKKSWKIITNLSGGEKTLSSLALVFALHYFRPTPFYVMDEIDAALDFKNVSIIGNYIKFRTRNAQFIIISLRTQMFELADQLVGIYKTHNCTKSIALQPETIAALYESVGQQAPISPFDEPPVTIPATPPRANTPQRQTQAAAKNDAFDALLNKENLTNGVHVEESVEDEMSELEGTLVADSSE